jgi:hypothetical protein
MSLPTALLYVCLVALVEARTIGYRAIVLGTRTCPTHKSRNIQESDSRAAVGHQQRNPVRIRGGRGGAGRSTATRAGASTTSPRNREVSQALPRAGGAGQCRAGRTRRGLRASLVRPRAGDRRVRHGGYALTSATETAHRNRVRRKGVG